MKWTPRAGAVTGDVQHQVQRGRDGQADRRPADHVQRVVRPQIHPTVTARGFALPHRPQAPIITMTTATARSLGLDPAMAITLATTSRLPTVTEEDRLRADPW